MKEQFKLYLQNQLAEKQNLLTVNGLTDEDKAVLQSGIDNLTSILTTLDESEDTVENDTEIAELKDEVNKLNDKIVAVIEKLNQNKQTEKQIETDMTTEEYLKSENAIHDFAEVLRASSDVSRFGRNWGEMLTKNGIEFAEGSESAYLPELVKGKIKDAWEKYFPWLSKLNKTNAKQFAIRWNSSTQTDETSRAKGHKKGENKVGETITLNAKTILAKAVYKLIEVDNETIFYDDNSLINYVLDESLKQWFYEVARAILVGDGRSSGTPDLRVTSIESILRSVTDDFVTVQTRDTTTYPFLIEEIVKMRENIKLDGVNDIILVMSMTDLNSLRKVVASSSSTPVYMSNNDLAEMIGVSEIFTTDILGTDATAIMFSPSNYDIVGEDKPKLAEWEDLKANKKIFRYENFIGGAVGTPKSAAVLLPAE